MLDRDPAKAQIGEEILPFEVGYLPEFFQKKAELELHETPEKLEQCQRQLKELINLDKKLMNIDFEDDFLVQVIRSRKLNVERAFLNLKAYVSHAQKNPEIFTNYKFEEAVKAFEDRVFSVLPWRCQDGSTLLLLQLDKWKPDNFSFDEFKRTVAVVLFQTLRDPMTQVNGFKIIFDVKSSSLRHVRYCTPHNMYLLYHGFQECVPGRFKGIHIVNDSMTFKAAWLIIKHFLTDKFKKRMHFHSTRKTLLDFFPRAVLPVAFGGELEEYDLTTWLKNAMTPEELAKIGGGVLQHL